MYAQWIHQFDSIKDEMGFITQTNIYYIMIKHNLRSGRDSNPRPHA